MKETLTCKETVEVEETTRFRTKHLSQRYPLRDTNAECQPKGNVVFFNLTRSVLLRLYEM